MPMKKKKAATKKKVVPAPDLGPSPFGQLDCPDDVQEVCQAFNKWVRDLQYWWSVTYSAWICARVKNCGGGPPPPPPPPFK